MMTYNEAIRDCLGVLDTANMLYSADDFAAFESGVYITLGWIYGVRPQDVRQDFEDMDWK